MQPGTRNNKQMKYYKSPLGFIKWEEIDIERSSLEGDTFVLRTKKALVRCKITDHLIFEKGKNTYKEFNKLTKLKRLSNFKHAHNLSNREMGEKIGKSSSALRVLFNNNQMSDDLENKIREHYPTCFEE